MSEKNSRLLSPQTLERFTIMVKAKHILINGKFEKNVDPLGRWSLFGTSLFKRYMAQKKSTESLLQNLGKCQI
jgi:hypothetical protein